MLFGDVSSKKVKHSAQRAAGKRILFFVPPRSAIKMGCASSSESNATQGVSLPGSNASSIGRENALKSQGEASGSLGPPLDAAVSIERTADSRLNRNAVSGAVVCEQRIAMSPLADPPAGITDTAEASARLFVRTNSKSNSVGGGGGGPTKKMISRLSIDKDCFVSIVSPVGTPGAPTEAFALSLNDDPPMEYKSQNFVLLQTRRISKGTESVMSGDEPRGSIPGLSLGNLSKDGLHALPTRRTSQTLVHLQRSPGEHPSPLMTSPRTSLVQFTHQSDMFSLEDNNESSLPAYLRKSSSGVAHRRSSLRRSPQRTDEIDENYSGSWSLRFGGDVSFRPAAVSTTFGEPPDEAKRLSPRNLEHQRCGNASLTPCAQNLRSPCASAQSVRRLSFTSIEEEIGGDSFETSVNRKHREQLAKPKVRSAWTA